MEIEKSLAKYRWEMKPEERNQQVEDNKTVITSNNKNEIYDDEKKIFNFRKMKASDLPFNRRIYLPNPLKEQIEKSYRT